MSSTSFPLLIWAKTMTSKTVCIEMAYLYITSLVYFSPWSKCTVSLIYAIFWVIVYFKCFYFTLALFHLIIQLLPRCPLSRLIKLSWVCWSKQTLMSILWLQSMTSELAILSCYVVIIMTLNDVGEMLKELDVINIKGPNFS